MGNGKHFQGKVSIINTTKKLENTSYYTKKLF